MTESVLIGTCGWEHDAWAPGFYPPELPADWRFCFFSNRIRSVIVPASAWSHIGPGSAAQWVADSDPGFRFILELPPELAMSSDPVSTVENFFATLPDLRDMTAAVLLPFEPGISTQQLNGLLSQLVARHPVCVRAKPDVLTDPIRQCLRSHAVSLCWWPEHQAAPADDGNFLVAMMEAGEPRFMRGVLEQLARWQAGKRGAGLYFTGAQTAPDLAEQARALAEMLGV